MVGRVTPKAVSGTHVKVRDSENACNTHKVVIAVTKSAVPVTKGSVSLTKMIETVTEMTWTLTKRAMSVTKNADQGLSGAVRGMDEKWTEMGQACAGTVRERGTMVGLQRRAARNLTGAEALMPMAR